MLRRFILLLTVHFSISQIDDYEIDQNAKFMDFSSQQFTKIETDFSEFTELEKINYSNNDIEYVEPNIFKTNKKLEIIDFSGNKKLNFPDTGIFLESSAKVLNLSNCGIEYLPGNALDRMTNLEVLDLSGNPFNIEESLGFVTMKYPPKKIILTDANLNEMGFICKHHHLKIQILATNKIFHCKKVKELLGQKTSNKNEDLINEELETNLILDNFIPETHMEDMLGDDPNVGSGDGDIEEEAKNGEKIEEKEDEEKTASVNSEDKSGEDSAENTEKTASKEEEKDANEENSEGKTVPDNSDPNTDEETANSKVSEAPAENNNNEKKEEKPDENLNNEETPTETKSEGSSTDLNPNVNLNVENKEEHKISPASAPINLSSNPVKEPSVDELMETQESQKVEIVKNTQGPMANTESERPLPKTILTNINSQKEDVVESQPDETVKANESANISESPSLGANTEASSSSNVILILVIAAVVVGAAVVAFKHFKDRKGRHQQLSQEPPKDREMVEIKKHEMEVTPGESIPCLIEYAIENEKANGNVKKDGRENEEDEEKFKEAQSSEIVTANKE